MNAHTNGTPPLLPLASRRRLVIIGAAGLLLIFASVFMQAVAATTDWRILSVVGIVTMVYGWARFVLPGFYRMIPTGNLDERQQGVVAHAYATAYQILACGIVVVGLYFTLTDLFPALPELGSMADKSMLLLALIWTVIGLPAAILAWTEPDFRD